MAARELLNRRLIRRSLTEWARFKGFEPARHHQCIIDNVEAFLANPEEEVLLIFAPPGSAKSTYISHLLASSYLARHPTHSILFATHSVEFARRWGRKVRNDIASEGHILGLELDGANSAADRWALRSGGEYYAVGAGVGISGFRADLGLGDDFFGNREDAFSDLIRKKRWDWYLDDYSARLKPGAKRILINTRWHMEDVAGKVLEQIDKGQIKGRVVEIRAQAETGDILGRKPGEWLWDDDPNYKFGDFLRQRKRETSPMMWAALYQQRPAPEDGDFFKRDWFKRHTKLPSDLAIFGASDYAVTEGAGDFTEHGVVGIDAEWRVYLLDWWYGQTASDEWIERKLDFVDRHEPIVWFGEGGVIQKAIEPALKRRMRQRNTFVRLEWLPSVHDKPTRARSFQALAANQQLSLPQTEWADRLIQQLIGFPAGKYDDGVDVCSLIGRAIADMHPAIASALPAKKRPKDLWDEDEESEAEGWKVQ